MVAQVLFYDPKSPEDIAPYGFDFTPWLIPANGIIPADIIVTASVSISGSGLVATGALINSLGTTVTTMLSGGTAGLVYSVHFLITTAQGITLQRSGQLQVIER